MIDTYLHFLGDGAQTTYPTPPCDNDLSVLKVKLDGVELTTFDDVSYPGQVVINPAPGNYVNIEIYRETALEERVVDFTNPNLLDAYTQNRDSNQTFFGLQEMLKSISRCLKTGSLAGTNYNAEGKRICKGAPPVDQDDFVTKDYVDLRGSAEVSTTWAYYSETVSPVEGKSVFVIPEPYVPGINVMRVFRNGLRVHKAELTEIDSTHIAFSTPVAKDVLVIFEFARAVKVDAVDAVNIQGVLPLGKLPMIPMTQLDPIPDSQVVELMHDKVPALVDLVETWGGLTINRDDPTQISQVIEAEFASRVDAVFAGIKFKGYVANYSNLPGSDRLAGDTYVVTGDTDKYLRGIWYWNGSAWAKPSERIRVMVRETQNAGVSAGATVANTPVIRALNDKTLDTHSIATLPGGGYISLPAGTYDVTASVPGYRCNAFLGYLRNSAGTVLIEGTTGYSGTGGSYGISRVFISGRIVLGTTTSVALEMKPSGAYASGQGIAANLGHTEVYSIITIDKVG